MVLEEIEDLEREEAYRILMEFVEKEVRLTEATYKISPYDLTNLHSIAIKAMTDYPTMDCSKPMSSTDRIRTWAFMEAIQGFFRLKGWAKFKVVIDETKNKRRI